MARIAPNSAYLLFDDQPAMNSTSTPVPETASRKSTPTLRSATDIRGPKGSTPQISTPGTKISTGGRKKISLSAARGASCSLRISLIASATGWSSPLGPTRLGP